MFWTLKIVIPTANYSNIIQNVFQLAVCKTCYWIFPSRISVPIRTMTFRQESLLSSGTQLQKGAFGSHLQSQSLFTAFFLLFQMLVSFHILWLIMVWVMLMDRKSSFCNNYDCDFYLTGTQLQPMQLYGTPQLKFWYLCCKIFFISVLFFDQEGFIVTTLAYKWYDLIQKNIKHNVCERKTTTKV